MSFTPAAMGNQYTSSQGSPSLRVSHRGRLAGAPEHPVDSGSKSYPGQRGVVHGRGWGVGVGIPAAATGTPGYLPNLTSGSIQAVQVKHCILNLWLSLVNISRACAYSRHYSHADGVPASRSFTEFVFERHKSFALLGLG